jgi:exonuclease SbcD
MKILHIGDLHLGRLFHERSLIEDQRYILDQIISILGGEEYEALVVAGDVYDRSIPSPEAVSLWGAFLSGLRGNFPQLQVYIIPGNHDSSERLAYASDLFGAMGIHIGSDPRFCEEPLYLSGKNGRIAVFLLPFLIPGTDLGTLPSADSPEAPKPTGPEADMGAGDPTATPGVPSTAPGEAKEPPPRSQQALARLAAQKLEQGRQRALRDGATRTVLVAHLFASGGRESESERVFLGTAERVDPRLFESFDYVALGHLHRHQRVSENCWYAGSPLAYSFDEGGTEKVCLSVDLGNTPISVTPKLLRPLHPVLRMEGTFQELMDSLPADPQAYLEISLRDPSVIQNPLALLRQRYPNLLSIKQDPYGGHGPVDGTIKGEFPGHQDLQALGRRGAVQDFQDFLVDLYGSANPAEVELFRRLAQEVEHAAP